jgi:hypothetical protein
MLFRNVFSKKKKIDTQKKILGNVPRYAPVTILLALKVLPLAITPGKIRSRNCWNESCLEKECNFGRK